MAPRGVKALLKKTAPARLVGSGKLRSFRVLQQGKPTGKRLRGLTKRLSTKAWSAGQLPDAATASTVRRGGWKGRGGGLRRGRAVDAQVSREINSGKPKPKSGHFSLTKLVFAALAEHGLEPVVAQRVVCNEALRVGTAADVICYEAETRRLVVVELKCGCSGDKLAAAVDKRGREMRMQVPKGASDCVLHRHMLQLACTRELLLRERATLKRLLALGLDPYVGGALLYVNDQNTELYTLQDYWCKRAAKVLASLV